LSLEQQIQKIKNRAQQLLRERDELLQQNGQLKAQLEAQQQHQMQQAQTITALKQQVEVLKMTAGQLDEAGKKELEKTINRYLKEIDKAIALLAE
jgi:chromosome segregation ATPase